MIVQAIIKKRVSFCEYPEYKYIQSGYGTKCKSAKATFVCGNVLDVGLTWEKKNINWLYLLIYV